MHPWIRNAWNQLQTIFKTHARLRKNVCISVCISICISVCISVCISICISVCISICISVCIYICISVCISVLPDSQRKGSSILANQSNQKIEEFNALKGCIDECRAWLSALKGYSLLLIRRWIKLMNSPGELMAVSVRIANEWKATLMTMGGELSGAFGCCEWRINGWITNACCECELIDELRMHVVNVN